jgi:acetolactate synthase-1/2/3 large subunit
MVSATMRAAEAIVSVLEDAGVTVVFGIPGVHNLSLFEALSSSSIEVVVTRHEGAAAHAADGYARATGRTGIVITTTGPGAANALTGIGEAWAASSPVLHLTTQVRSGDVEAGVQLGILHQSPGQLESFLPLSKSAVRVRSSEEAPAVVAAAMTVTQTGRTRPAYVEVPFDLLDGPAEAMGRSLEEPPGSNVLPDDIERAARALAGAARVAVWAGGGAIQPAGPGPSALDAIARRLAAPVVTTYMGRTAIPASHPLSVGLPPHEPAVAELLASSDALLAVGTDFGATTTKGGTLRLPPVVVQVDIERDELAKHRPTHAVLGPAVTALSQMDACLAGMGVDRSADVSAVAERLGALRDRVWRGIEDDPRTAEAAAFVHALQGSLPTEAVVACDMCIAGYWVGAYLPLTRPRSLLYPLGWGTLGFGLPAAVGAAAAGVGPVLAIVGDAGFLYYVGELATARQHDLDLTLVVVNDRGYGMLRFDETQRFGRTFNTDLSTPDLEPLARAFGVPYERARIDGTLQQVVGEAMASGGPRLIEVRATLYPPRTTSPRWEEPA